MDGAEDTEACVCGELAGVEIFAAGMDGRVGIGFAAIVGIEGLGNDAIAFVG